MSEATFSLKGLSVMVGIPAGRDFPPNTVKSLVGTFQACERLGVPCSLGMIAHSSVIQWARDEVVDLFLASDANRLFWIDSDIVWEPGHFIRLLALTQVVDVVGGAYPAKLDQPTFFLKFDPKAGLVRDEYGLVQVQGLGLGFTVVTRKVIEDMARRAKRVNNPMNGTRLASLFRIDTADGNRRGEDMAFFADVRAAGYKVWLDPSVALGHVGTKVYTGSVADAMPVAAPA